MNVAAHRDDSDEATRFGCIGAGTDSVRQKSPRGNSSAFAEVDDLMEKSGCRG